MTSIMERIADAEKQADALLAGKSFEYLDKFFAYSQKYNTGLQGFKTSGVDSIPERLGGQEFREFHKGGASAVGV